MENVPMSRIMKEIEKQTRYLFISKGAIDTDRKLSLDLTDRTIREVLDQMVKGSSIQYDFEEAYIILSEKPQAASARIAGRVLDAAGRRWSGHRSSCGGTTVGVSTDTGAVSNWRSRPRRPPGSWRSAIWAVKRPV